MCEYYFNIISIIISITDHWFRLPLVEKCLYRMVYRMIMLYEIATCYIALSIMNIICGIHTFSLSNFSEVPLFSIEGVQEYYYEITPYTQPLIQ